MIKLLLAPFKLLALLVGNFSWTAPSWLRSLLSWLMQHLRFTIIALLVVISSAGGYFYYQSLPKPVKVIAVLNDIEVMPSYYDEPSRLLVEFEYDLASLHPEQTKPEGNPSAARIDLVGQRVESGIELIPSKKGEWRWISDRELEFMPETDWAAGAEYQLKLTDSIFAVDNKLAQSEYLFSTPPIKAEFAYSDFYQDPLQGSSRKVVTTIEFSHPVDKDSLEKHLKMSMRESGESISATPRDYQYSVSYSANMREAYIHSENINLPEKTNYMLVELLEGVKSLLGGTGTKESAQIKVTIPDVYSFLKVESNVQIIRNQQNEPQQIVTLDFTDALDRKELLNKLSIYALPVNGERQGRRRWDSPRQVSSGVLANSKQIDFEILPNADEASKLYSLKIEQQPNRFLYLKLEGGFGSINQFKHASKYDDILKVPEYPREISIAGEGSVLSYSGNHQLSVLTRGVSALKYTIGRVRNSELNHLISQTEGDISNPEFMNWNFDENNIAEMQSSIVKLRKSHPKKANYSSFDLSAYLSKGTNRYGLFFVDIKEYDLKRKRTIYGATDRRLILITDLGLLVKNNSDTSHDVFVQSIATGEPVANAKVELIGKNGLAVYSGTTDSSGHIKIPVTRSLNNDKQPTLYTVESAGDRSFIPFNRYSRQINLSRFDIGGVHSSEFSGDSLNAFVFSDRGIYRPGETANFGMIVKSENFENVEDIPLELVIQGPRYNEVKVDKFRLPKKGLAEFEFETLASSDTGRYTASLHLVRDDSRRGYEIGTTEFRVEEFQPDTMRIESKLVDIQQPGWNIKEKLTAKVTLTNLFGTAAQNRTVRSRLIIEPHNFRFRKFSDYRFTDPFYKDDKKPLSLNQSLKPQQTNADGIANFELDLAQFQQGTYRLRFLTEGFDQAGGRSVSTANAALISPLNTLVGYKSNGRLDYINANTKRSLEFIAINQSLEQIATTDLTFVLKEIQTVSTLVKQEYGTFEYQSIEKQEVLSSENISVAESGYQYSIDSSNPGDYVIEIIDSQGRRLAHLKYSVVGYANLSGKIDKSAELELKLNKQDYFPSEFIEMNIRAPYKGAGLITIETNKVIKHKWFKTEQESSVQRIQLPDDIEGTGYINVSFLRDASSDEIFTAPLSYAVK
ncbi:MAG: hypothetical protein KUG78_18645, partial [Kangiellaceae bacterium]|nr:hypothetical protein [Kangiellaceae bacterium]